MVSYHGTGPVGGGQARQARHNRERQGRAGGSPVRQHGSMGNDMMGNCRAAGSGAGAGRDTLPETLHAKAPTYITFVPSLVPKARQGLAKQAEPSNGRTLNLLPLVTKHL